MGSAPAPQGQEAGWGSRWVTLGHAAPGSLEVFTVEKVCKLLSIFTLWLWDQQSLFSSSAQIRPSSLSLIVIEAARNLSYRSFAIL